MRIHLTKLTDERHRLAIVRADGSAESVELETRSFLLHDLVHYAVEAEAGMRAGFWGLLAAGASLASLADRTLADPKNAELARAETLVGPMQSVWNGRLDKARYIESSSVDEAFVERVLERLRGLWGHWRATRFRGVMELSWPPEG